MKAQTILWLTTAALLASICACRSSHNGSERGSRAEGDGVADGDLVWTTRWYPTGKRGTSGLRMTAACRAR